MQSIIQFMTERFSIFRAIFFHCWLWCVCIPVLVLTHFLTGKTKPRFGETERMQEFPEHQRWQQHRRYVFRVRGWFTGDHYNDYLKKLRFVFLMNFSTGVIKLLLFDTVLQCITYFFFGQFGT